MPLPNFWGYVAVTVSASASCNGNQVTTKPQWHRHSLHPLGCSVELPYSNGENRTPDLSVMSGMRYQLRHTAYLTQATLLKN